MSSTLTLLLGVVIGAGAVALVYLVVTRRLRFTGRPGDSSRRSFVISAHQTDSRTLPDRENAEKLLEGLPPEAAEAVSEALAEGWSGERVVVNQNGEVRVYDSLDDVPPELRERLRQAGNRSGTEITIEVNGRRYSYRSREDVPPEFRRFLPGQRPQ